MTRIAIVLVSFMFGTQAFAETSGCLSQLLFGQIDQAGYDRCLGATRVQAVSATPTPSAATATSSTAQSLLYPNPNQGLNSQSIYTLMMLRQLGIITDAQFNQELNRNIQASLFQQYPQLYYLSYLYGGQGAVNQLVDTYRMQYLQQYYSQQRFAFYDFLRSSFIQPQAQ